MKISCIPELIGLKRIPHFTTLIRFSKKLSPMLVRKLLAFSVKLSKPKNLNLGIDATGLDLDRASAHYSKIRFLDVKRKKVLQLSICATTDTQMITSVRVEKRRSVVSKELIPMVKESAKFGKIKNVTADKGYDGCANHEFLTRDLKIKSLIKVRNVFSKRNRNTIRKRVNEQFNEAKYHQRSKIETIFSVIKAKYDAKIRAKQDKTQIQEGMQKTITYNIDRLSNMISQIIGFHQRSTFESTDINKI